MIEAIIFDLDGSMVDSMWLWKAIDIEYLGRFGIELPENLQMCIEGMSFSETAVYFKERFALPDDLDTIKAEWNRMAWDKYTYEVPVKDGVIELLEYCRAHKIKAGIATSNSRELVENVVKVHRLDRYFDCIMTGCDVAKGKPAPDIYLAVARKLDVTPANCLVFEDIIPGIQAGRAAGMKVCAVYDKYSEYQEDDKRKMADYYTYHFHELIENGVLAGHEDHTPTGAGEDGIFTDF
ncbi:MAG: HAD family phosphatase [Eubacterium sp.]|nr:HAD family phosphatase [Eubacterium sp.]